jgi:hypothetical protein
MKRALLIVLITSIAQPGSTACEEHCVNPCAELNGDVTLECGSCVEQHYHCRPGGPGYPSEKLARPAQASTTGVSRVRVGSEGTASPELSSDITPAAAAVENGDEVADGVSCAPYLRTIGEGDQTVRICPIMNGIWTSFLDHHKWGAYDQPLDAAARRRIVDEMVHYDRVGLGTWIGEDFDERVLSALEEHSERTRTAAESSADGAGAAPLAYSIIVENGRNVVHNLEALTSRLGPRAVDWVQLGPPALEHLPAYRAALDRGVVLYGVEDYTTEMLRTISKSFKVATVQQEINAIVRPSHETLEFCRRSGCHFIGYGPLLGGLLSDRYLGVPRPTPDRDHTKQIDYLDSIEAWADWPTFQKLLGTLRAVGNAHGGAPITAVALAYLLQLERVAAAIVGVRLGHSPRAQWE